MPSALEQISVNDIYEDAVVELLIVSLTEADEDEETLKDILGPGMGKPEPTQTGSATRVLPARRPSRNPYGSFNLSRKRWADVQIGEKHFCISYLTVVAVFEPGVGIRLTDRYWSASTKRHITAWAAYIGVGPEGGYRKYADLEAHSAGEIPQKELTQMFREEAATVNWSKQDMRHMNELPDLKGFKHVDDEDRVRLQPYRPPEY